MNPIIPPTLLAEAVQWAETTACQGLAEGRPLDPLERAAALAVGVRDPDAIRIVRRPDPIPMPDREPLRSAARTFGLGGPAAGLTLGHAIFLARDPAGPGDWLLRHECRHVKQFEDRGGMARYLEDYLGEVLAWGYAGAPMELDALAWQDPRR